MNEIEIVVKGTDKASGPLGQATAGAKRAASEMAQAQEKVARATKETATAALAAQRAQLDLAAAQQRVERATVAAASAEGKYGKESIQGREAATRLARAELEQAAAGQRVTDSAQRAGRAQVEEREATHALTAAQARATAGAEGLSRAELAAGRSAGVAAGETRAASRAADAGAVSHHRLAGALGVVGSAARTGMAAGLLVAAGAAAYTIKIGINYQQQLNMMQAVTHATAGTMAEVAKKARDLGNDLTLPATSAGDAAQAMTELAKGNLTAKQAMDAAKGTLQLAAAAQITGAEAAKIQADALGAFSLKASAASHVADVLANAANSATGEISDFAQGLAASSAVAHQFGLSVDDTVTALALFANAGIHGSDAGTSLKSALLALASPSSQAADALKVLNLHAFDAHGRFVGLESISQQLATAQGRLSQQTFAAATSTAFGSDAARAAGVLAANGAVGWEKMAAGISKTGGAAAAAGAQMKGVGGALAGIKSEIETIAIDVFTAAAPTLERFLHMISGGLPKAIDALKAGFQSAAQPASAFAAGLHDVEAGLAPIGAAIGATAAGFKPMGQLLMGIGAAGDAATTGLKPMGPLLGGFVNMGPLVGSTAKLMGDGIRPIGQLAKASAEETKRAGLHRLFFDIGSAVGQTVVFIRRNMPTWKEWAHVAAAAAGLIGGALGKIGGYVSRDVGPALKKMTGWINDNRFAFAVFGAVALEVLGRVGGTFLIMAGYAVKGFGYIIGAWAKLVHIILAGYGGIIDGAVTAFGWIPGLGDKLRGAKSAFDKFSGAVEKGMAEAAVAAGKTGDGLIALGHKAIDAADKAGQLRRAMAALRSRQLIIQAIDRAKPVAIAIQRAITQVRGKTVNIVVNQVGSIQHIQREIDALTGKTVSVIVGAVRGPNTAWNEHGGIIGAAGGGARGGLTWVGEAGRELVRLPYGSTVYPHGQSEGMAATSGGGGQPVVIQVQPGGTGLDRMFVDWLRNAVRTRGGVDVVFNR